MPVQKKSSTHKERQQERNKVTKELQNNKKTINKMAIVKSLLINYCFKCKWTDVTEWIKKTVPNCVLTIRDSLKP